MSSWFQYLDCHHHNPLNILLHGEQGLDVVRLGVAVDGHPQDQLQQATQVTRIVFHHLKICVVHVYQNTCGGHSCCIIINLEVLKGIINSCEIYFVTPTVVHLVL